MSLVKNQVVISCVFSVAIFSSHAAESAKSGQVNMQRAIVDTACSISTDSREQVLNMGVMAIEDIRRDGFSRSKELIINLENCILKREGKDDWKQFQITFDGDADGNNFDVNGEAGGVALQILDKYGSQVTPKVAQPLTDITPGSMQLKYNIRLVINYDDLKAGEHFSTLGFKLDYF